MVIEDIVYSEINPDACKLDLYLPDNMGDNTPIYVYIHGGGLAGGGKAAQFQIDMAQLLNEKGIAVANIDYRMYPNAHFPDFIVDSANAVAFLMKDYELSDKFGSFAIGGESAGGYITQMLYFNKAFLADAGVDSSRIKAFIMDAGQPTAHFNVLNNDFGIDGRAVLVNEAAAFYYLREEFKNPESEPYIAIFSADHDMVNRMEQNLVLKTALLHFGFPENKLMYHVFEGCSHCAYCGSELYRDMVNELLQKAFN